MAELLARDHGVRLVYKDLPILGPASVLGSKALLAAQKQGGYEKLRDAIMAAPPQTTKAMIQDAALRLGLDWKRLEHDMDDPAIQARINANLQLARSIGIEGTPGAGDRRRTDSRRGRSVRSCARRWRRHGGRSSEDPPVDRGPLRVSRPCR